VIVKICGITRAHDAEVAVRAGADWIGLNFWPGSKRAIDAEIGRELAEAARAAGPVAVVGVFVDAGEDEIRAIDAEVGLDHIQLHGDEPPRMCTVFGDRAIKAIQMAENADIARLDAYPCDIVLLDAPSDGYGGSGTTFNWKLARAASRTGKQIIVAGGLRPDNVAAAVAAVAPFGVDVASGVEAEPGIKDPGLVRAFVRAAKGPS
jgi:phosphoribosylanthranilate isomerase